MVVIVPQGYVDGIGPGFTILSFQQNTPKWPFSNRNLGLIHLNFARASSHPKHPSARALQLECSWNRYLGDLKRCGPETTERYVLFLKIFFVGWDFVFVCKKNLSIHGSLANRNAVAQWQLWFKALIELAKVMIRKIKEPQEGLTRALEAVGG